MKIAIIGPRSFPPSLEGISGLEIRLEQIINYLSNNNDVFVFTRSWIRESNPIKSKPHIHIIKIWTIKNKYFDTLIYSILATFYAIFLKCNLFMYEGTGSATLSFLPRYFNKKVLLTIHSIEWKRTKWNFIGSSYLKFIENLSIMSADHIITVSRPLHDYMLNNYNKKSWCIPFYNEKLKKPNIEYIDELDFKENQFILYLGRITPEKRIEWIIHAFNELKPKIKLVIAGPESHDHKYFNKIKVLSELNSNIIFTGPVNGKLKEELIAYCFLFILPSSLEGFPISLIEAINYKRNILVSDLIQHREVIISKFSLFASDSYKDFKRKLKYLLFQGVKNQTVYNTQTFSTKKQFFSLYDQLLQKIKTN